MTTNLTPDAIASTLERLRRMRHSLVMTAPKPDPDGTLVPILNRSAEVCALDVCIRMLESQLRELAS